MIPFPTPASAMAKIGGIVDKMELAGLDCEFTVAAYSLGLRDEGVYDLMVMWNDSDDPIERAEIEIEIRTSTADYLRDQ